MFYRSPDGWVAGEGSPVQFISRLRSLCTIPAGSGGIALTTFGIRDYAVPALVSISELSSGERVHLRLGYPLSPENPPEFPGAAQLQRTEIIGNRRWMMFAGDDPVIFSLAAQCIPEETESMEWIAVTVNGAPVPETSARIEIRGDDRAEWFYALEQAAAGRPDGIYACCTHPLTRDQFELLGTISGTGVAMITVHPFSGPYVHSLPVMQLRTGIMMVLVERLRKSCPDCRENHTETGRSAGCAHCRGGVGGVMTVMETLLYDGAALKDISGGIYPPAGSLWSGFAGTSIPAMAYAEADEVLPEDLNHIRRHWRIAPGKEEGH